MTGPVIYLLDRRDAAPAVLAAAERRLSPGDRARRAYFERHSRREQFVLGRALLRYAVARVMGCEPGALEIARRDDGRAHVMARAGSVPRFSLSHSGDWIACAVHPDTALGLDVECMDAGRDFAAISSLAFSAGEHSWLLRQPSLNSSFYHLWTGREALTKLDCELGESRGRARGSLVADDALVAAPAPAGGWYHTEVRPGVALSLVWEGEISLPEVEVIDHGITARACLA